MSSVLLLSSGALVGGGCCGLGVAVGLGVDVASARKEDEVATGVAGREGICSSTPRVGVLEDWRRVSGGVKGLGLGVVVSAVVVSTMSGRLRLRRTASPSGESGESVVMSTSGSSSLRL